MELIDIELAERILENQMFIMRSSHIHWDVGQYATTNTLEEYERRIFETEELLDKVRAIRPMVGENG